MLKKAFTLIEILIVVILLGILAAVVVPNFVNTADEAREAADRSTLRMLKSQVELYKAKESAAPTALSDLETAGYIDNVPEMQSALYGTAGDDFTVAIVGSN